MTVAGVLWSALVALAAWTGLREAGAPAPARVLAVIAVLAIPAGVIARHGPLNDLPALAWLSTTAALCVAAVKRPALLAPALVAAGLAGGTKTTALPLAVVALLWAARPVGVPRLRSLVRPLLAALALALACGGVWYLRNLVLKGSPVWPFSRGPFGDPLPRFIVDQGHSLLERPRATLRGYERAYLYLLGGGLVLFVGAAVAAVATRRRAVVALTGLSAASGLLWVAAPFTGVANDPALRDAVLSTLRYLLPALAAAASALAICAATPGWPRRLAYALLVGAIAGDVAGLIKLDVNYPLKLLLGGAAAGGVLAAMARRPVAAVAGNPVAPVAAVCLVLLALGARADGITKRHVLAYESDRELVSWFSAQPAFRDGQQRIWGAPTVPGSLVGDRLRHAVTLIPPDASCARIQGWARDGWIVVTGAADRRLQRQAIHVVRCMPGRPLRFHSATTVVYGPPTGARAST
jgi:hypothetical protein